MKERRMFDERIVKGPDAPAEYVVAPKNRRERRVRAAQHRKIRRAVARGETPRVFVTVGGGGS